MDRQKTRIAETRQVYRYSEGAKGGLSLSQKLDTRLEMRRRDMQLARFEFSLFTENSYGLPDFKGPTFRGKFGHVLKRTICVMRHRNCERCELRSGCAFPYLFETENERGESVPRPFVLEPPLTRRRFFLKDHPLHLNMVLFGKAIDYLPYFVYCFERMGKEGIGQDRGRYRLESVAAADTMGNKTKIYERESQQLQNHFARFSLENFSQQLLPQVTLTFLTPTTITAGGKPVLELSFEVLLKNILRRYRSLNYFHGDGQKQDYPVNWEATRAIEIVHQDLQVERFKRYSNRQQRPVPLAGFTGNITYRGEIGPFLPWLKTGEYLHIGKGAVFGLGWFRVMG
jgi:CRISPR-associated endoribonuclease Cas6